jgi:hypothetical protein
MPSGTDLVCRRLSGSERSAGVIWPGPKPARCEQTTTVGGPTGFMKQPLDQATVSPTERLLEARQQIGQSKTPGAV